MTTVNLPLTIAHIMQYDTIQAIRMSETPKVGHKGAHCHPNRGFVFDREPRHEANHKSERVRFILPLDHTGCQSTIHLYPYNSHSFIPIFPMSSLLAIEPKLTDVPSGVSVPEPFKMAVPDAFWVCCLIITQQNGRRTYKSSVSS